MPWLAPECARGEGICSLSDVYAFCALVWETCTESLPWYPLCPKDISDMWHKNTNRTLSISDAMPQHVASFLKLGLQPRLEEREDVDLQEIYLMLRLQAATLAHTQQKETPKNVAATNPPVPPAVATTNQQHAWETVKERMRKRPNEESPEEEAGDESEADTEYTDFSQQNMQPEYIKDEPVHQRRSSNAYPDEYLAV